MPDTLVVAPRVAIPHHEFAISYVRSSGPGGQHLNKVSTKAVLRWNVVRSTALPDDIRRRFLARYSRRVNAAGDVIITSQRFREQRRNHDDCLTKLRDLIRAVANPPKHRVPTRPSRSAVERRLAAKQRQAEKKRRRRLPPAGD